MYKNIYVIVNGIEECIGTVKEFIYDNEKFYLIDRYGMNETVYNENEIDNILNNFIVR